MPAFVKRYVLRQTLGTSQEVSKQIRTLESDKKEKLIGSRNPNTLQKPEMNREVVQVTERAFLVLFCIVGMALWGLPFYYDFMVQQFGWTHAQVTSGNALSKLVVGPIFGFIAGWMVDRFGARRRMMAGILMAGAALAGLGTLSALGMVYFFYMLNGLGYGWGGPAANQVLLSRQFDKSVGNAIGFRHPRD